MKLNRVSLTNELVLEIMQIESTLAYLIIHGARRTEDKKRVLFEIQSNYRKANEITGRLGATSWSHVIERTRGWMDYLRSHANPRIEIPAFEHVAEYSNQN